MKVTGPKQTIERARQLRQTMSKPERLLWWALRRRQTGFYFRRQHPAGLYVLDFYCDALRLCIEVDGNNHDFRAGSDWRRDDWLRQLGVETLRIPAAEVLSNLQGVVQLIVARAQQRANVMRASPLRRSAPPPPEGEERASR